MSADPDSAGGKGVAFALASLESVVWFEQQLWKIGDLLADESVESIVGHVAIRDEYARHFARNARVAVARADRPRDFHVEQLDDSH